MSIEFTAATPVERKTPGRVAEPNPYIDAVKSIALKTDGNGVPLALAFVLSHDVNEEGKDKAIKKAKRQLSVAGKVVDPQVTVHSSDEALTDSVTKITFWTVPFKPRPRKTADNAS